MKSTVYDMVTERIIKQMEQGVIPWRKPWFGIKDGAFNRVSKKEYSLLNQMLLKHTGEYASFKQWTNLGGHIRKGEKSEIVVFWKIQKVEEIQEDGTIEYKNIPLLRYYNVFHISQVDGVKPLNSETPKTENEPIDSAENLFKEYISREGIRLEQTASDEAYYSPSRDLIHLPLFEQFKNANEFYSTAFHEATHSTMKESRCNRRAENKVAAFGSQDYSKEELVAEIGSASILNYLGIETPDSFKNSVAYIQNWLQVLKNDSKFIVSASSRAEKAMKYILNEE